MLTRQRMLCLFGWLLCLVVLASLPASAQVLVDSFNENQMNPAMWRIYSVGSGPTVALANQRLEISFPANCSGGSIGFAAGFISVSLLRGDFDMQVDYQLLAWPATNGVRVGLNLLPLQQGGATVHRVSLGANEQAGQPRESYTVDTGSSFARTATSDLSGKLRMVRTGTTITGYYLDQTTSQWVAIGSSGYIDSDVYFALNAFSGDGQFAGQPVKVAFSNFKLNKGTVVCPLSPNLLLQNSTTGQLAGWFMDDLTALSNSFLLPVQSPAWKAVAAADFNADGQPDLLFQNPTTGQLAVWYMNGIGAMGGGFVSPAPPSGWTVAGAADFNNDGRPDLLLYHASTGQMAVWYLNGLTAINGAFISPSQQSGWKPIGAYTFSAAGTTDIYFFNASTGQLAIWELEGTQVVSGSLVNGTQASGWQARDVLDINQSGLADVVFQNSTTGQMAAWLMNGASVVDAGFITPTPPSGWQPVGPQ